MHVQEIYVMVNTYFEDKSEHRSLFEWLFEFQNAFYAIGDYEDVIDVATVGGVFKFWFVSRIAFSICGTCNN